MDPINTAISTYRAEDTTALDDPDADSIKVEVIEELEEQAGDRRVIDFFLEVAADSDEYDLARIEVFRIFQVLEPTMEKDTNRIAGVIADILLASGDDGEVRNYAAIAAGSYFTAIAVRDAVRTVLLDAGNDRNLRANAFAALESAGADPFTIQLVQGLRQDPQLGQTAQRVLKEWGM